MRVSSFALHFAVLISSFVFCVSALAAPTAGSGTETDHFKGFVDVASGHSLYVDWEKAAPGKDTVVLLNGLTYSTENWNAFTRALRAYGVGVLRYDPEAMGQTLLKEGGVSDVVPIEDQARDLDLVTRKLGLDGRLNLVGLSYGGGLTIAFAHTYGQRINKAILMAPYTAPLPAQDSWIKTQIAWTRVTFPLNPATDDQLYAYFLRQNVYYVYPYLEPSVLDNALKPEAVFQMTQGIRQFDIVQAAHGFPPHSVHLMVAENDQYIPRALLNEFWTALPEGERANRILIAGSEHKIPESKPAFAAKWVSQILAGQIPTDGASYHGDPANGRVAPDNRF